MPHVDEGTLHAYLDGALEGRAKAQVQQHLAACHDCRVALEEARALIGQAAKILEGGRPAVETVAPPLVAQAPRRRRVIPLAWAASLAVALAAGWFARSASFDEPPRSPPAEQVPPAEAFAMSDEARAETVVTAERHDTASDAGGRVVGRAAEGAPARDEGQVALKAAADSAPPDVTARTRARPAQPTVAMAPPDTQRQAQGARRDSIARGETAWRDSISRVAQDRRAQTAEERTGQRRADLPAAQAPLTPLAREAAADVAPPVDTLPGFDVARLAREGGVTTVHHVSPAGDTVVVRYEPPASPGDTTRVFQEGLVLARDAAGRPRLVVGVYRVVGPYRVTATGTVARDSLTALLAGLVSRSP